jgi:hypothetical protein
MILLINYNTLNVEEIYYDENYNLSDFLKSKVANDYLEKIGIYHRSEGFYLDISKNPKYDNWFNYFKMTNEYKKYLRLYKLKQLQKS